MKYRIFIGSSHEALDVSRATQQELEVEEDFLATVWDQQDFRLTRDLLDSLLAALDSFDAGVFVLRPDDLSESRGQSSPAVRDNVIFELGMFIGRHGRDRTFMLMPDTSNIRLPSDLHGITIARYDAERFGADPRAAVGSACTRIRRELKSGMPRIFPEPRLQARLDQAMSRLSKDLDSLLFGHSAASAHDNGRSAWPEPVVFKIEQANVRVEVGRIENYQSTDTRVAIALPANEYFDDECISDPSSALGAFVLHHFPNGVADFSEKVREELELAHIPAQLVPRDERIGKSYGIGTAIFLSKLQPDYRVILASVTTEWTGIGLRAEPHFLYAALEGIIVTMNERRGLNSLVMPVMGSGHGGIPLHVAILFNLLAVRSILADVRGRRIREVRIVVFDGDAGDVTPATMHNIISRVAPA